MQSPKLTALRDKAYLSLPPFLTFVLFFENISLVSSSRRFSFLCGSACRSLHRFLLVILKLLCTLKMPLLITQSSYLHACPHDHFTEFYFLGFISWSEMNLFTPPYGHYSWCWVRLKQGARNSIHGSHMGCMGLKTWGSGRELDWKRSSWICNIGCWHHELWLNSLCRNANPWNYFLNSVVYCLVHPAPAPPNVSSLKTGLLFAIFAAMLNSWNITCHTEGSQ